MNITIQENIIATATTNDFRITVTNTEIGVSIQIESIATGTFEFTSKQNVVNLHTLLTAFLQHPSVSTLP